MSLYNDNEIKQFDSVISEKMKIIKKKQALELEPYGEEKQAVKKIVYNFIKSKKRKVYGGAAQNMLITEKNQKDAFYSEDDSGDIEFYSPFPLDDVISLCNELHDAKFVNVVGQQAQHKETYSIFVNYELYCDVSYVPRNIYNKIPFKEIRGFTVVQPYFIYIDFFRMFSNPMLDWEHKFDSRFKRFNLLYKHYPLPKITKNLSIKVPKDDTIFKSLDTINKFMENKETIIAIGLYAYNHMIYKSGVPDNKTEQVPYYEMISTSYKYDAMGLIDELKKMSDKIVTEEHSHFFQFLGNSVYVYHGDYLLAIVYSAYNRCVPFHVVPALTFRDNGVIDKSTDKIMIGSFSVMMHYSLATIMQARVNDDDKTKDIYYSIISHMIDARNYYTKKNNRSVYNSDILSDFTTECKGTTITPKRKNLLEMTARFEKKKQFVWRYKPFEKKLTEAPKNMSFLNSSGNPIVNPKNLYLQDKTIESESDEETEDVTATEQSRTMMEDFVGV